ncbi:ABC transporter ATP-binding protein [Raineyella sp. W15-4]|uniref:ABC transporter ATP-binding protein n=1 Tax=Raineyella sp. W15-4 TaxID=3081651 RepID=UPI0029556BEC|nr:ABC transporter ATP-binding protein [Raineyella sp. W15-4]WOQ18236.1 ABC transporter ATP-binding protein [Raineyella sp. W15-4]
MWRDRKTGPDRLGVTAPQAEPDPITASADPSGPSAIAGPSVITAASADPTSSVTRTEAADGEATGERTIVRTEGLTKVYGAGDSEVRALDGVDISVSPGEFVTVMGPSGCGKSTLLNMLGGLDTPTSGRVLVDGNDLTTLPDDRLTELRRRRIGFVFQSFNLIPVLDAVENAALPLTLDGADDADERATRWLVRVGLADRLHNRPDELSGGQQQRVAVARALSTDPALVLADEPTGNLDSKSATEIAELLQQVAAEWHRSVLMVTHDPRIASYAQRLILMNDGRVVDDLPLDGSREGPIRAMERAGLL